MKSIVLVIALCLSLAFPVAAQQSADQTQPSAKATQDIQAVQAPAPMMQNKMPMNKMGMGGKPGGMMGGCPKMMGKMKGMMSQKGGMGMTAMMKAHMMGLGSGPLAPGKMMTMAMGPGMGACGGGAKMHGKMHMLNLGAAGLNAQQWAKVRELAYNHLKMRQALKAQMAEACLKAAYLGSAAEVDAKGLTAASEQIGRIKAQLFLNGRSYLDGLKAIVGEDGMTKAMGVPSGGM